MTGYAGGIDDTTGLGETVLTVEGGELTAEPCAEDCFLLVVAFLSLVAVDRRDVSGRGAFG